MSNSNFMLSQVEHKNNRTWLCLSKSLIDEHKILWAQNNNKTIFFSKRFLCNFKIVLKNHNMYAKSMQSITIFKYQIYEQP